MDMGDSSKDSNFHKHNLVWIFLSLELTVYYFGFEIKILFLRR